MTRTSWTTRTPRRTDDGGSLVIALLFTVTSVMLVTAMLAYVMAGSRQTGQQRQREAAASAAEGQADTMISAISNATAEGLPCSPVTVVDTSQPPDTITVITSVTYMGAGGGKLPCPLQAADTATTAVVSAVATSNKLAGTQPVRRVVEALLRLTAPKNGPELPEAIFADRGLTLSTGSDISSAAGGLDADVYTNGDFTCRRHQTVNGAVVAKGNLRMKDNCTIEGDATAGGNFYADTSRTHVSGRVAVPHGNAVIHSGAKIDGGVQARGKVTWPGGCPSRCSQGSPVGMDPAQSFPKLSWDPNTEASWLSHGFTVVTDNNCTRSHGLNGPSQWLAAHAEQLTRPTLLRTTCAVSLTKGVRTLNLGDDLAIFADGGISVSGVDIRSTSSTRRRLYLVQPYNAVTKPCKAKGISLGNRVTIDSTVSVLLYTPCSIRKLNHSELTGQIYSGNVVKADKRFELTFDPLPIFGVTGLRVWKVDLLNKRDAT